MKIFIWVNIYYGNEHLKHYFKERLNYTDRY